MVLFILIFSVVFYQGFIKQYVLYPVTKREIHFSDLETEKWAERNFSQSDTVGTEVIENGLKKNKSNSSVDHHREGTKIYSINI